MSRRTERIAGELLVELSRLLHEEVTDPRVGLVTLTRVDVAPDLSHALVFWSALDLAPRDDRDEERQAGLDSASAFLRRRVASALPLRRMPELRFRYDPSLVLGTRTLSVLREVAPQGLGPAGDAQGGGGDPEPPDEPDEPNGTESEHGAQR
jgi:ribosome-binding factor A